MYVMGVDGCRRGWVVFRLDLKLATTKIAEGQTSVLVTEEIGDLLRKRPEGLETLGIDMPIGLADGRRDCDRMARSRLGFPRSCSVFPAPCRAALGALTYSEACSISETRTGKKLSRQTWLILPKVRQVDEALPLGGLDWVMEVHPEVSFAEMTGGKGIAASKKTEEGRLARLRLLEKIFPGIGRHISDKPRGVGTGDLLDAAAACWTAWRRFRGLAVALGGGGQDERGLRMQIWS